MADPKHGWLPHQARSPCEGRHPRRRTARDASGGAALGIEPYVAELNLTISAFGPAPGYEPRLPQTLLDDAARGHTLTATVALLSVSPQTLSDWQSRYPEFAAAAARARSVRRRIFEGQLIDAARRGADSCVMSMPRSCSERSTFWSDSGKRA
jgi:hypothetical protein